MNKHAFSTEQLAFDIQVEAVVVDVDTSKPIDVLNAEQAYEVAQEAYLNRLQHFPTQADELSIKSLEERELLHGKRYVAALRLNSILARHRKSTDERLYQRSSRIVKDYQVS